MIDKPETTSRSRPCAESRGLGDRLPRLAFAARAEAGGGGPTDRRLALLVRGVFEKKLGGYGPKGDAGTSRSRTPGWPSEDRENHASRAVSSPSTSPTRQDDRLDYDDSDCPELDRSQLHHERSKPGLGERHHLPRRRGRPLCPSCGDDSTGPVPDLHGAWHQARAVSRGVGRRACRT